MTIKHIDTQIQTISDPSLSKPLLLQKNRLEIQKEHFEKNITLLKNYQNKLQ